MSLPLAETYSIFCARDDATGRDAAMAAATTKSFVIARIIEIMGTPQLAVDATKFCAHLKTASEAR
jgi:hypothetical protein